jgi:hypothetical protein
VQVGGDLGAFLGADALRALLAEVADQPQPERDRQHGHPDQRGEHREQGELHLVEARAAQQEHADPGGHEDRAGQHPDRGRPAAGPDDRAEHPGLRAALPAAALLLVGLPPDQRGADQRHRDAARDPAVEHPGQRADPDGEADAHREQAAGLLLLLVRDLLVRGLDARLGHEHPEQAVREDTGAAEGREQRERHPHPQHADVEVVRDPARDTGDGTTGPPATHLHVVGQLNGRALRVHHRLSCLDLHAHCAIVTRPAPTPIREKPGPWGSG